MPLVHLLLMTLCFQSDESIQVIEHGRLYLTLNPEAKESRNQQNNHILSNSLEIAYDMMALSALKLKNYDLAIEFCNRILQHHPESFIALNTLAQSLVELGQNTQAINIWTRLLQRHPDQAEVYRDISSAYYRLGDVTQAVSNLKRALQLQPDMSDERVNLNTILMMEQQLNLQIAQYNVMLQSNPNDPALHDKLARILYQNGDCQTAIEHLRQAIWLKPDWAEPYMNLAGLLATTWDARLRNPQEAVELAQKAAQLTERKDVAVLERLSVILDTAGKYDEAIQAAEEALILAQADDNQALVESLQKHIIQIKSKRDGIN